MDELNNAAGDSDEDHFLSDDSAAARERDELSRKVRIEALKKKQAELALRNPPAPPPPPPTPSPLDPPPVPAAPEQAAAAVVAPTPPGQGAGAGEPSAKQRAAVPSGLVAVEDFDLFAATDERPRIDDLAGLTGAEAEGNAEDPNLLLRENWTDGEGYYVFKAGEVLNKRYVIEGKFGNGVFSIVLKGRDQAANVPSREDTEPAGPTPTPVVLSSRPAAEKAPLNTAGLVAIKVVKSTETMMRSGYKELDILRRLASKDPKGKRHCVRFFESFLHRGHLCIVLEPFPGGNLREVLKKYGRIGGKTVGLSLSAVRSYSKQLVVCLKLLADCSILHADFKPDNILVSGDHQTVKLADFGSAMLTSEVELTPYLVSRFYRPPEVVVGLRYGHPMDMWALGCTAYELFTGKMMFAGDDNNAMLHLHQTIRGGIPKRLLRKAAFADKHFSSDFVFMRVETDPVTRKRVVKPHLYAQPTQTVKSLLEDISRNIPYTDAEKVQLVNIRDFIEKATVIDPAHRLTPEAALAHPFITSSTGT
ncbi:Serine/threonine-protein kinase prp4 [Diplonema papillatum]|nr:Serine/threonine-protein kinase prp4 [Diplonema papillatum]KAJ9467947.1 Serine/threonine-protein kinase prp4 [Diplonema papillatum]